MGVGVPRAGLRPGLGQYPGESGGIGGEPPQIDASEPSTTLYPSDTLYPYQRYIKRPSPLIYPGIDLRISTVAVNGSGVLQVLSFARGTFPTQNWMRSALLAVTSTARTGFSYLLPSEAARRIGVKVQLASSTSRVILASPKVKATIASLRGKVRL